MKLTKKEIEMIKNAINWKIIKIHEKGVLDDIYLIFPTLNSLKLFFMGEPEEIEFNDILFDCENEEQVIEFMNELEGIDRWEIR